MPPLLIANLVEGVKERMKYRAKAGEQGSGEVGSPPANTGQQPPVLLFLRRARETERLSEAERQRKNIKENKNLMWESEDHLQHK